MNIEITSYETSEQSIRLVRDRVFLQEQNVDPELEWDGKDPDCIHVLAFDGEGNPIGTGRCQHDGKIGRLAVLKHWRGRGIGAQMLAVLVESTRNQGLKQVCLHAQVQAVPFYAKYGFTRVGGEFMEADIPHVKMTRQI